MSDSVTYFQINKDHAYWTEKRRFGQTSGGHTSGLLSHYRDGVIVESLLFDVGMGTIEGLHDAGFCWKAPLSVFVTHAHIDHHAELMVLSELWCKREAPKQRAPLKVFCTGEEGDKKPGTIQFLQHTHGWGFSGGQTLAHVPLSSKTPVSQGIFTVHSVDVDHFPGSVIYVVEFWQHKVLIAWDMKTLPDPEQHSRLQRPSLALLEANTWTALSQRTGHTSVEELIGSGFVSKLGLSLDGPNLYGAYLVHFGGGEDPDGAISDSDLDVRFRRLYPHLAGIVGVARRGQQWTFAQ